MTVVYPNEEELEVYKEMLLRLRFSYLPPLDDRWVQDMHAMFALVRMIPECAQDFSIAAANLFFKIIKNHRRYDGNKRSAICCLVFFMVLNNRKCELTNQEIEELALEVAGSSGNSGNEFIPRLRNLFDHKIILTA